MATLRGRGPQVVLEGYARNVARGVAARTMRGNIAAMDQLVIAGLVADGNTLDGSSRTGGQPYDVVVAQYPDETTSAWEIPAPLLDISKTGLIATGGDTSRSLSDRFGEIINIRDLGAACDGVTDDTAAWALAFTKPNGTVIRVPQNCVSMVAGNAALSAGNRAISIIGDGPSSVIRVSSAITARLFSWNGASGVRFQDLTIDLSLVPQPGALIDGVLYMQIGSGLSVRNVRIINSPLNLYLICFHNVSDFTVERCFLQVITGSSTVQSKGIACESSLGPNTNGRIVENTLVHTNTNFSGSNQMYIAGNDISGWGVGAGISNGAPAVGTATNRIIIGNRCHDSLPAIDMFGDVTSGMEEWSITATIANNLCWNCGGYGILLGGDNSGNLSSSLVIGNQCWDNYRIAAGSVTAGGIVLATGASGTCIVDNHCWDSGAGTQPYGFNIANAGITNLTLAGNIFRGVLGDVSRMGVATFQNNIEYTPRLLSADPTVPLGAATKQYVDSHRGNQLLYQTTTLVGNGADTTIDVLQSFSIPGGTLVNVGDRIVIKAGGGYIGSTDGKTISVTWGGGGSILNLTGSTAAAIGWRIEGEFIKTASGVQTGSLSGVTNAAAVAVDTLSLTRTDTGAIVVAINGQNGTNPTASSLTCRYFTVDYIAA